MKPVILVTADRREPIGFIDSPRVRPKRPECYVKESYLDAVREAGGVPLIVPPGDTELDGLLAFADGVVLTGGDMDIHPSLYGHEVAGRLDRVEPRRTALELELARRCLAERIPILGICGGMQVLAVAGGGTLIQDLPTPESGPPGTLAHEQLTDPAETSHAVHLTGTAAAWLGDEIQVNSTHHQAVLDPGRFSVSGRSSDGVVEAIEAPDHPFAVGVQWHPERIGQVGIYRGLIEISARRRASKSPPGHAPQ